MADFKDKNNQASAAYVAKDGVLVTQPKLWLWTAQGKVFEAGLDMEDTAINSIAAFNDEQAQYALVSPSSSSLFIIPILLRIAMTADGNALTDISVSFTKPAGEIVAAFSCTGTAMTTKQSLYATSPPATAQKATALTGCTVSVLTADEWIEYARPQADDAFLTSADGSSVGYNVITYRFLSEGAPRLLNGEATMLVTVKNGNTAATSKPYMQWAEVTLDDLL